LEFQKPHRRVEPRERAEATAGRRLGLKLSDLLLERMLDPFDQRLQRLVDDERDEIVGRVIAAGALAGEDVRPHADLAVLAHDLVLQQPLIYRAELLDAEVPVIDVATLAIGDDEG